MAPPGIFVVLQDSNSNIFMKIMVQMRFYPAHSRFMCR